MDEYNLFDDETFLAGNEIHFDQFDFFGFTDEISVPFAQLAPTYNETQKSDPFQLTENEASISNFVLFDVNGSARTCDQKSNVNYTVDHSFDFNVPHMSPLNNSPQLGVVNLELWKEFCGLPNEMIISPKGRLLFPSIELYATNLDINKTYTIAIEFKDEKGSMWKYDSTNKIWYETMKPLKARKKFGVENLADKHWYVVEAKSGLEMMSETIDFKNVRIKAKKRAEQKRLKAAADSDDMNLYGSLDCLSEEFPSLSSHAYETQTNENTQTPANSPLENHIVDISAHMDDGNSNVFILQSGHKYMPTFYLIDVSAGNPGFIESSFTFEELEFIACTHYKNPEISDKKVLHNRYASGIMNKKMVDRKFE